MKTLSHSISYALINKLLLVAIASSFVISCSNTYEDAIVNKVESYFGDNLTQYDEIVIIPGAGCSGCISQAERYFLDNSSDERNMFIFTYFISKKSLILRMGRENIMRDNVLIDTEDRFYVSRFHDNIYPYILKVKNGHVVDARSL